MDILAEYIWIDGTKPTALLRSKTKVLPDPSWKDRPKDASYFPDWVFDGSSTEQASGGDSDRILKPVCFVPDPTRLGPEFTYESGGVSLTTRHTNYLVLCEVFNPDGTPHESNMRAKLRQAIGVPEFGTDPAEGSPEGDRMGCWFGFEQEHTLFKGSKPLGFPTNSRYPPAQGPYYCGVGADEAYGRPMVEAHLSACVKAGLLITGINAEVAPGQWEFQIGGPGSNSLSACDHLWLARWLLHRIGEDFGITATFDAKPIPGDWNGAGLHSNFSNEAIRSANQRHPGDVVGIDAIHAACGAIGERVQEHLAEYGVGIEARLTGEHETAKFDDFGYGNSDRTKSIRIPTNVVAAGCGYFEDRRPNANADPYRVASVLIKSVFGLW